VAEAEEDVFEAEADAFEADEAFEAELLAEWVLETTVVCQHRGIMG
jgi:hypothetical protein